MILNSLFKLIEEKAFSPYPHAHLTRSISPIPQYQKSLLEKKITSSSQKYYYLHEIDQSTLPNIQFPNKLKLIPQSHHISIYQYADPSDYDLNINSPLHYTLLLGKAGEQRASFCIRVYFDNKLVPLDERKPFELVPIDILPSIPVPEIIITKFINDVKLIAKPFFDELKNFVASLLINIQGSIQSLEKNIVKKNIKFKDAARLFSEIESSLNTTSSLKIVKAPNIHSDLKALESKIDQINPRLPKKENKPTKEPIKFFAESDSDSETSSREYKKELLSLKDNIQQTLYALERTPIGGNFFDTLSEAVSKIEFYSKKLEKYSETDQQQPEFKINLDNFKKDFQKILSKKIELMFSSMPMEKIKEFVENLPTKTSIDLCLLDFLPIDLFKEILFSNKIDFFDALFLKTSKSFQKKFTLQYIIEILDKLSVEKTEFFINLLDNIDFINFYEVDSEKKPLFVLGLNHAKDSCVKLFRKKLNENYFFFDISIEDIVMKFDNQIIIPDLSKINKRICFDVSSFKGINCSELHTALVTLTSILNKAKGQIVATDKELSVQSIFEGTIVGDFFLWLLKDASTHPAILFNILKKYELASTSSEFSKKIKTLKDNLDKINLTIFNLVKNQKDSEKLSATDIFKELDSKSLTIFSLHFLKAQPLLMFSTSKSKKRNKSTKKSNNEI